VAPEFAHKMCEGVVMGATCVCVCVCVCICMHACIQVACPCESAAQCKQCTQDGDTCLHTACQWGHLDIVKRLCEVGGEALVLQANDVSVAAVCCSRCFRNIAVHGHAYAYHIYYDLY
jgi:hypothetical protein